MVKEIIIYSVTLKLENRNFTAIKIQLLKKIRILIVHWYLTRLLLMKRITKHFIDYLNDDYKIKSSHIMLPKKERVY